jgi:hypothetical protein
MTSIRTLVLEYVDQNGASHIRELHIEVLQRRPGTPRFSTDRGKPPKRYVFQPPFTFRRAPLREEPIKPGGACAHGAS